MVNNQHLHIRATEVQKGDHIEIGGRRFVIELIRDRLNPATELFKIFYMEAIKEPKILISLTMSEHDKITVWR